MVLIKFHLKNTQAVQKITKVSESSLNTKDKITQLIHKFILYCIKNLHLQATCK